MAYRFLQVVENLPVLADAADHDDGLQQLDAVKQGVVNILGNPAGEPGSDCRQAIALLLHMDQVGPGEHGAAGGYPGRVSLDILRPCGSALRCRTSPSRDACWSRKEPVPAAQAELVMYLR